MMWEQLDLIFPFFVFAYGAVVSLVTHLEVFERLAEQRLASGLHSQLKARRGLALICLVVGGLWSLQHIWYLSL